MILEVSTVKALIGVFFCDSAVDDDLHSIPSGADDGDDLDFMMPTTQTRSRRYGH